MYKILDLIWKALVNNSDYSDDGRYMYVRDGRLFIHGQLRGVMKEGLLTLVTPEVYYSEHSETYLAFIERKIRARKKLYKQQ